MSKEGILFTVRGRALKKPKKNIYIYNIHHIRLIFKKMELYKLHLRYPLGSLPILKNGAGPKTKSKRVPTLELNMTEGSLEVKLPTIWTDEKQSRAEAERRERLEERRSEKRKSQRKEDADARKGRKVAKHCVFFQGFGAPEGRRGGVGQSKNWSRGDWVWVILIVEPIWKWYAWCVFCAGAHGVWYSWYSTGLCPLKKWFLLNFDFGTCEEPTVNRPKRIQKTHANYL